MYSVNITDKELARLSGCGGENGIQREDLKEEKTGKKTLNMGAGGRERQKIVREMRRININAREASALIKPTRGNVRHLQTQLVNGDGEDIVLF